MGLLSGTVTNAVFQYSIPPPPPPPKYCSPEDSILLEDESGRITLVGDRVKTAGLVTGVVIGALGVETPNGEFEVVDLCYPGLAPQSSEDEDMMDLDGADEWIAVVSGLSIGSPSSPDVSLQMLVEYLTGEEGGIEDQVTAARISRLVIAGNSLAAVVIPIKGEPTAEGDEKKSASVISMCAKVSVLKRKHSGVNTTTIRRHFHPIRRKHLLDTCTISDG